MLAILLGCGFGRFEVIAPTFGGSSNETTARNHRSRAHDSHVMRVKGAIDLWIRGAGFSEGAVLGRVSRGDQLQVTGISQKSVLTTPPAVCGCGRSSGIVSHDLSSCAKLCRAAGGALKQVELLLGACVFETTERYLESR